MPEEMASKILADLGNDRPLPLDILGIIKSYGIDVQWAGLTSNRIGIYIPACYVPDGTPVIICSRIVDQRRARFTLAHELYHHIDYITSPNKQAVRFSSPNRAGERMANRFAGALLMPRQAIKRLHSQGKDEHELADIFNVSRSAIRTRISELGLITQVDA